MKRFRCIACRRLLAGRERDGRIFYYARGRPDGKAPVLPCRCHSCAGLGEQTRDVCVLGVTVATGDAQA